MTSAERLNINFSTLTLIDGMCCEDLFSQLQPFVDNRILLIKNGYQLEIHKDKSKFPICVVLEKIVGDVYYFRDKVKDDLYALFGYDAAVIFCPSLNDGRYARKIASLSYNGTTTTVITDKIEPVELTEKDVILD